MKPARLLLIILGALLGLAGLVGGLLLTPAVQRWALLRAMQARSDLQFEAATVAASLSQVQLGGVRFKKSDITVQIGHLEADYSLWRLLLKRQLVIGRLTGRGLLVDASKLSAQRANAAAAGVPAAAPGLLTQIKLPVGLVLADCVLEGRVLLPGSVGGPPVEATCQISGGQIAPGQEGELVLAADLKNSAAAARVTALRAELRLRVRQTEQKTFSHVSLTAVVEAEGRDLRGQEHLKLAASLAKTAGGENYEFTVDTLLGGKAEKVLALNATLPAGGKEYAGSWQLLARTAQLEPFFLGAGLPDFQVRGEGRFTFNPTSLAASLQGGLTTDVSRLEAWEPAWRAFGVVKLTARFDLAGSDSTVWLNQLQVALAGEQPVLELTAAHAVRIDFKEPRLPFESTAPGEGLTLTLHALPVAWLRPFVRTVDLSGGLITGQVAVSGQTTHLNLSTPQPLRVESLSVVQAGQLLLNKADVTAGFHVVLFQQEMQATVTQMSVKTASGDMVYAQAKVTMPVGSDPSVTIVTAYTADLPTLLAPWLPLGRVKAAGEADFTVAGQKIELRRLQVGVTDAAGLDLFKATALRPFVLDFSTGRAEVADAKGAVDLLRVSLGRVPLAALPMALSLHGGMMVFQPASKLGGVVAQGGFVVAVDGDKIGVHTPVPIKLADVSLTEQGRPALTGLMIEVQPSFELTGKESIRLQSGDITVRGADGTLLLNAKGEVSQSAANGTKGSLNFSLEVPALATQPIFAGTKAVSAGRASGEIRVALGSARQVEARLTVNGLVASASNEILPVANLSFRAVAQPDGKITVQAPLLLDRAGVRSDLGLAVDLSPAGRGYLLDGKLTGQQVELTDALAVLGVFMASAAETPLMAESAVKPSVVADAKPAWSRLTGRLALEVKSVIRGTDWAMSGLTGLVVIEPADITLQKLEATFGEKGRFAAKGLVSFTRGPQPYDLAGDFSLTEFDAGKLFTALDPAKPATIEGMFTVAGRFTGTGETLGRTLERSHGTFGLTGRQGIFRGLQRTTNKVSLATKAVDLVGSLFGSSKVVEKVAGAAYYVDQLALTLGELNYDRLNVKLVRDQSLNVALEDISLVAPEIRLIGKGTVTYVPDKPLLQQPLSLALSMAGRGKVEEQLGKLRLLNGARDDLDYARTKEILTLGGTLARPDPTVFFTRLATAKLADLLAPEN